MKSYQNKTLLNVAIIIGGSFLVFEFAKKFFIDKDSEKSETKISDEETAKQMMPSLQSLSPAEQMLEIKKMNRQIETAINSQKKYNQIKDLLKSDKTPNQIDATELKNQGDGVYYFGYNLRPSNDKKGRLVVTKIGGKKNVYKIFGNLYLPFKVKSLYDGAFSIKKVEINPSEKSIQETPIKLIDNTGKTLFVQKKELDNLINRFEENSKKFKFITDKADLVLTKVI